MARATFLNAILSGKLDGQVYARNKGGAYVRSWVKPTNPKTLLQSAVRSGFSDMSKQFNMLVGQTKEKWNYYASSYFKPKRIKPGVIYSGFNAFQSLLNTQKQANRNYRPTTISNPTGTVVTGVNNEVLAVVPPDLFTGQPIDGTSTSVPITIINGTILVSGTIKATFELGRPVDMADLQFADEGGNRQIGFLLYGNVPNSNSPTENICLGFSGFLTVDTATETGVTQMEITISNTGWTDAGRKMWYTSGQKAIMTAYAVSNYGELSYLGNCRANVA